MPAQLPGGVAQAGAYRRAVRRPGHPGPGARPRTWRAAVQRFPRDAAYRRKSIDGTLPTRNGPGRSTRSTAATSTSSMSRSACRPSSRRRDSASPTPHSGSSSSWPRAGSSRPVLHQRLPPEVYTQVGFDWVNNKTDEGRSSCVTTGVGAGAENVDQAFAPWPKLGAPAPDKPNRIVQLAGYRARLHALGMNRL